MKIFELTARQLADALARGELSSVEIVEALYRRIDEVNGMVHAIVQDFREEARARARAADEARARGERWGSLHGLPITIKESIDVEGVPSTLGIRNRLARPASEDAVVVRAARDAGAILLGKTNVPQTLLAPMETTNEIWGTTRNPFSLDHAPGGSSGGEGVAIATGMSPMGIGGDIGGSIRMPAAYCGIAGLKPTTHRWSLVGSRTILAGQEFVRSQVGPMARTVSDLGFLLRALDPREQSRRDPSVPPLPIDDPDAIDLRGLRVGYYESDGFLEPAQSMKRAMHEALQALERRGVILVEYRPPNVEELIYLYFAAVSSDGGETIDRALGDEAIIAPLRTLRTIAKLPDPARRIAATALEWRGDHRVARLLRSLGKKGVDRFWELTARRTAMQLEEQREWKRLGLDALVCPVHVTPAPPHGLSHDFTIAFAYVARYNLLGLPAGVVPIGRVRPDETTRPEKADRLDRRAAQIEARSAGLPTSVQIVGPWWREDVVLAVMGAIEAAVRDKEEFPRTPVQPVDQLPATG